MKEIFDRFVKGAACALPTEQFCSTYKLGENKPVFVGKKTQETISNQGQTPVDPGTRRNR